MTLTQGIQNQLPLSLCRIQYPNKAAQMTIIGAADITTLLEQILKLADCALTHGGEVVNSKIHHCQVLLGFPTLQERNLRDSRLDEHDVGVAVDRGNAMAAVRDRCQRVIFVRDLAIDTARRQEIADALAIQRDVLAQI